MTPDYRVNTTTGEVTVYYRFGGRAVAYRNSSGLRYVLSDHLSSTHGEVGENQAEVGQRRYFPFGTDRAVAGASDIADEERYTSQRRIDAGNGNARREIYHYGARAYLPGVGIFTQADSIVPDYGNPQALNRFAYVLNNPMRYNDPTGHFTGDPLMDAYIMTSQPTPAPSPMPVPAPKPVAALTVTPTPSPRPAATSVAVPAPTPVSTPIPENRSSSLRMVPTTGAFGSPWNMGNDYLGVVAGEVGGGQRRMGPHGTIIYENVSGPTRTVVKDWLGGGQDNAVTIGHVILNSSEFNEDTEVGARWLAHEDAHVRQSEVLGPAYLPFYGMLYFASGQEHDQHPMEIEANEYRDEHWLGYLK